MWRGRNLVSILNDSTLFYNLPCKEEEIFLSRLTKAAELLLMKTTVRANEEISWSKELLLESPWCNQYIGLSCASPWSSSCAGGRKLHLQSTSRKYECAVTSTPQAQRRQREPPGSIFTFILRPYHENGINFFFVILQLWTRWAPS